MSQRAKRPNRSEDGSLPVKRRKRTAAEEEEAATLAAWQPPRSSDLKSSSIYNRTTTEAPAELFRKDLISAMKLPDSEPLASNEYWVIVDQWKQEWERGVQVPVNPDSLPEPSVCVTHAASQRGQSGFKLPKTRYIRITKDDNFKPEEHFLSNAPAESEAACGYDLDECDVAWLRLLNAERAHCGQTPIQEEHLERVIEQLELTCWDKIQTILKNEEGLGIEYDENVICDVCRSPDSEEGNEMVFCDSCNICVHQACYGITRIPEGQWLCCTCNLSKRPKCVLCPNKGGAMKCTRSGQKWAHVSCALWIPEVSIGCVEKMEPITKISSIPQSRWALICVLCRERVGACIQCSVKTCKTAYHVTCAFKHGLEMRAIIEDENADDGVKLRSYCEKHSKSSKKEKSICSGSEDDDAKQRKKRKDMTSEEKNQARAARLQEIESEFHRHVSVKDVAMRLVDIDADALHHVYNYWKLKRRAGKNKPLLPPKSEDVDVLSHKREQADLEKMKMFVQLRQDLERVRNLCYMVSRREKLSRSFFRLREQTFHKQVTVLESSPNLAHNAVQAVIEANHGPSIYDRLYSRKDAPDHTASEFDRILARIAGLKSPDGSGDERKLELNGLFKDKNPYKKVYFNGMSKRRSASLYGSSSSSDERHVPPSTKPPLNSSSSEDENRRRDKKPTITTTSPPKKSTTTTTHNNNNQRKKRHSVGSSSEDDVVTNSNKGQKKKPQWGQYSRSRLMQVERELGYSGSDSDELMMPVKSEKKVDIKRMSSIYSDSDSSDVSATTKLNEINKLRTKAAVKEFSHKPSTSKASSPTKKQSGVKGAEVGSKKDKKNDYVPSDLIVPQRQAAKKASENLKTTTTVRSSVTTPAKEEKLREDDIKEKEKPKINKVKGKEPPSKKEHKNISDIFDLDKEMDKSENQEILAYVPQRQAAKKAAEHIKSGLGKPTNQTITNIEEASPKKDESTSPSKITKKSHPQPPPPTTTQHKSSSNSSSSSSSSTSSDSSSSSGSDSEEEQQQQQKKTKQQTTIQQTRSEVLFSNGDATGAKARPQNVKDWPFLDKAAKSSTVAARTPSAGGGGSSSDEQSSDDTSERSAPSSAEKQRKQLQTTPTKSGRNNRRQRKAQQQQQQRKTTTTASSRGNRQNSTVVTSPSKSSERVGDVNVRIGDLSDGQRGDVKCINRKGKQQQQHDDDQDESKKESKSISVARKQLQSPKEDKKLGDLEKEILERKAAVTSKTTRSTLDRLFGTSDKKTNFSKNKVKTKSTVKENKEPEITSPKKSSSSVCSRNSDDVFMEKNIFSSGDNNQLEIKEKREVVEMNIVEKVEVKPPPQNRSIFSPQHMKESLLDFDNLDDGFGMSKEDEIMKGPLTFTFSNNALFKEDSKEDSARETLNLVEKLRMELSKKSSNCDVDDVASSISSKTENEIKEIGEQVVPNSSHTSNDLKEEEEVVEPPPQQQQSQVNLEMRVEVSEVDARTTKPLISETSDDKHYQQQHHHHDFRYVNCEADVPLEGGKNIPLQQHQGMPDRGISAQGDERWVPPSDSYIHPPYLQQYHIHSHHLHLPPKLPESPCSIAPPPSSSCSLRIPSCDATSSMDCLPSPSPYADLHPQAKWADSEIMPSRRSSSSSAASTSSSTRGVEDEEVPPQQKMMMVNHQALDMATYLPPPFVAASPFVSEAAAQFANPVSLFPSHPSINVAMFPPGFGAFTAPPPPQPAHVAPPPSAPPPYTAQATFTSTQHNMELTTAMVNPTKEVVVLEEERTQEIVKECVVEIKPAIEASPKGKKSPSKPTRTSTRVTSGKSPKQEIVIPTPKPSRGRGADSRRNSVKSTSSSSTTSSSGRGQPAVGRRGRGRGRGRSTQHHHHHHDYDSPLSNTIHNKLVGTVYDLDFDDDISSENVDLKSMRERRKSVEQQQKINTEPREIFAPQPLSSTVSYEESISPKVTPLPAVTPEEVRHVDVTTMPPRQELENQRLVLEQPPVISRKDNVTERDERTVFPEIVQPVLPGPVDMRTYSTSFDQQSYTEQNLLRAFATGTTETQVNEEIDEEFEKELHTALTSSTSIASSLNKKEQEPVTPETNNIKVSLSDSRNQLKVKIKGPIANYSATMPALPPPISNVSNYAPNNVNNSVSAGGTSNLRRMRKKELLRQYWNQDANMDVESSCVPATPAAPPVSRTIITIPKAVASMTSIPTKDDYRDYRTGNDEFEVKNRKETKARPGALSRELRQLDLSLDVEGLGDRRRSLTANASHSSSLDSSLANKRRGRPPRPPSSTPKIKIKIGNSSIVGRDDKRDRIRPPKKRLANINMPSVEDLKRESMKYRKLVMADFGETKEKRKKKDKSEKRKKKKSRPPEVMQVISNETENPTKLIIRIGKKVEGERTSGGGDGVGPIKFKLTRCQEGSGYVVKKAEPGQAPPVEGEEGVVQAATAPPPPSVPLNKDCEVR